MRWRHGSPAVVLAAAALVAGCGGDDAPIEPASTTSTDAAASGTLSAEEFITSADARCAEANAALANLSTDAGATSTVAQEQSITASLLSSLQDIGDAEDPDGSLNDFYAALSDQADILDQQQQAIASGDTATADSLDADLSTARADAMTAAEAYGFQDCGQEGTELPDSSTSSTAVPVDPATTTPTPATTTPVTPSTTTPVTPAPVTPTEPSTGGTGGTPVAPSGGGSGSSGGLGTG